jgi:hypothetical protein
VDLADRLLKLAAAVRADGGDDVVRALAPMLREEAPFDAGEVAVASPIGFTRWALTPDERPVAAEDFLLHLTAQRRPIRIDERRHAGSFRRTQAAMDKAGLRSLLALPLATAGGLEGAIVLARAYPWAFVAAPLRVLTPLASLTALALEQSRALTRLEAELSRPRPPRPASEVDEALQLAAQAEQRRVELTAEKATLLEGIARREEELVRLRAELVSLRAAPRKSQPKPPGAPKES